MSKGVLIIATGHPNYIRMAFNLAFSIKFKSPCSITIAHSEGLTDHLNDSQKQFIDQFIVVPKEYYTYEGKVEHPMVKTRMYDLSPYDQTLYLDADTIWFQERPIDNWFKELEGQEVAFQCEHKWKMSQEWGCLWTSNSDGSPNKGLSEIKAIYNIPEETTIYEMQSSFMYFEKGDKSKAFYDTAKEIYLKRPFKFYTWANGIPDELVFNISTAINKIELKQFPYKPLFFFEYHNNRDRGFIYNNYYALSMAGNNLPTSVIDIYDTLVKYYYSKIQKVRFPYLWKNKKQFLPERSKA